jgi:hypothetical protein
MSLFLLIRQSRKNLRFPLAPKYLRRRLGIFDHKSGFAGGRRWDDTTARDRLSPSNEADGGHDDPATKDHPAIYPLAKYDGAKCDGPDKL